VQLALSGLTAAADGDGASSVLVITAGSLIVVAMGIVVVWRLGRVRRPARSAPLPARRSPSRIGKGTGSGPRDRRPAEAHRARRSGGASANGHRRRPAKADDQDEIDLLIDEIAALDLSFERGVLDEARYRALRATAKRRLVRSREARAGDER
jgi:hypothetical protein